MLLVKGESGIEAGVPGEVSPFLAVLFSGEGQSAFERLSSEREPWLVLQCPLLIPLHWVGLRSPSPSPCPPDPPQEPLSASVGGTGETPPLSLIGCAPPAHSLSVVMVLGCGALVLPTSLCVTVWSLGQPEVNLLVLWDVLWGILAS